MTLATARTSHTWGHAILRQHRRTLCWLAFAVVVIVGIALALVSWRRWGDPEIDFGVQLYLPWRVLEGEHLVRDYVHPYGPFSTYFNAALFRIFGVAVSTLVVANLAIYAAVVWLLFQVLRRCFGFLAAWVAILMALPTFGFAYLTGINNYNYISPYSHEATHGVFFLALLLFWVTWPVPRCAWLEGTVAGVLAAFVALTKVEVVAAAVAVMALVSIRMLRRHPPAGGKWLAGAAGGALAVLLPAWALLASAIGPAAGLRAATTGILAPFLYSQYALSGDTFRFLGVDQPKTRLAELGIMAVATVAALLAITGVARLLDRLAGYRAWLSIPLAAVTVLALTLFVTNNYARAAPLLLIIAVGAMLWRIRTVWRRGATLARRHWNQILFLAAAVVLMARMALAPKVEHYGFYQLMLATLWLCGFYATDWPRLAAKTGAGRRYIGAVALGWNLVFAVMAARISVMLYSTRTLPMATGADRTLGYSEQFVRKHKIIEDTRAFLAAQMPPKATLLVLPEGISLNYLLRRKHPLRITNSLPPALAIAGDGLTAELNTHPPDWVVVMTRPLGDDVYAPFGSDDRSGRTLLQWLQGKYAVVASAGDDPVNDHRWDAFGVWILRRRASP